MVGWTALNSYSNKSSQAKRKLLLFPSGFTPHYYIRIKSQDYNKTHNANTFDNSQKRPLHYQNLWKKSIGKGENGGRLLSSSTAQMSPSVRMIYICHLLFFYFFYFFQNSLRYIVTHLSTNLYGFHKGTHSSHLQITGVFRDQMLWFTYLAKLHSSYKFVIQMQKHPHGFKQICIRNIKIILAKAIHAEWHTNKNLQVDFMHHNICFKSINAGY